MDSRNATSSNQDKRAKGKGGSKHEQLPKDGSDGHCHTCKKNFRRIPDAVRHVKEVHKAKRFKCPNCIETFTRQPSLTRHIGTVHDKTAKQVCSICEEEFANFDTLRRHVNDIHKAEREYECSVHYCPLTFARKDTRDKHEARARKDHTKHGVETECNQCGEILIFPTLAACKKEEKKGFVDHKDCQAKPKGVFLTKKYSVW